MKSVTLALLAFALAGCKDSTPPSLTCGISGTSDVNVNGAVTATANGCATYAVSTGANSTGITLTHGKITTVTHVITLVRTGGRPATGTYTVSLIGGSDIAGSLHLEGGSEGNRIFTLSGGTIDITTSSAGTLRGTFNSVTAREGTGPAAPTVTITGNFRATCVDISDTDC